MRLLFITVGKNHDPLLEDAISDFTGRIGRTMQVEWKFIPHSRHTGTEGEHERAKIEEGEAILAATSDRDILVSLDEKGKAMSTKDLAQLCEKHLNQGTHRLVFIIGGAYGLSSEVLKSSQEVMSLSKLTFPHQLVRLILAEQVYRACSILKGEKYHHE